jgi:hypothetical protein
MRNRNRLSEATDTRRDAFLCFDETMALHPLHTVSVEEEEVPETYPSGL